MRRLTQAGALLGLLSMAIAACGSDEKATVTVAPTTTVASTTAPTTGDSTVTSDAPSTEPATTLPLDAPDKLTIGLSGGQGLNIYSAHNAARGQGYFDEIEQRFDMKFEFVDFGSGADTIAAFLGGGADAVLTGPGNAVRTAAEGQDAKLVVQTFTGGAVVLIGRKELEATHGTDITKYADAVWGYTGAGATTESLSRKAAEDAGLVWDDIEQVAFGQISAATPGLESGRLDIVAIDVTAAARAIEAGIGYLVYNGNDPANVGELWGNSLTLRTDFIEQYPAFTQALVDAYLKGLRDVREASDDPEAVRALFLPEYQAAFQESWESSWELIAPAFQSDGGYSDQSIEDTIDFFVKYGFIPDTAAQAVRDMVVPDFVRNSTVNS